jgi:hypothetical protein
MMQHANHRRSIRVINGLKSGNLTKALQGEDWKNPVKNVIKLEVLSEK